MTADEIMALATKKPPIQMPDGLNAAEQLYFLTMRAITAEWRAKRISGETARKEGLEARRAFDGNAFAMKCSQHSAELWKNIEMAAMRFTKEHTIEAADFFFQTVYGLGENWRLVSRMDGNKE